jgi:NADH-quinone oxidoreductase subunit A
VRFEFSVILILLTVSAVVVGVALWLTRLVAPQVPDPVKAIPYECGERPIGRGWYNFNPRFYLMALVFIVFDVEIALTYPVAVVVRQWVEDGRGLLAVAEIALFLGILAAGLAYVWGRGDLDWARELSGILGEAEAGPDPAPTITSPGTATPAQPETPKGPA